MLDTQYNRDGCHARLFVGAKALRPSVEDFLIEYPEWARNCSFSRDLIGAKAVFDFGKSFVSLSEQSWNGQMAYILYDPEKKVNPESLLFVDIASCKPENLNELFETVKYYFGPQPVSATSIAINRKQLTRANLSMERVLSRERPNEYVPAQFNMTLDSGEFSYTRIAVPSTRASPSSVVRSACGYLGLFQSFEEKTFSQKNGIQSASGFVGLIDETVVSVSIKEHFQCILLKNNELNNQPFFYRGAEIIVECNTIDSSKAVMNAINQILQKCSGKICVIPRKSLFRLMNNFENEIAEDTIKAQIKKWHC